MRKFWTANGGMIIVPPKAEDHLRAHPEVGDVLQEAIGQIQLPRDGSFLSAQVDMKRDIGYSGRLKMGPIAPHEKTLFAQRLGRSKPSRVAPKGVTGTKTWYVSILATPSRQEAGTYVLVTAWVGTLARKEPWDPMIKSQEEYRESLHFWCNNALVWDPAVMSEPFESSWEEVLGGDSNG